MLAHKKAVPRIVFMAEERAEQNLDIHIVPTGLYYSSYWKFNRNVIVNFGKPILVNDYLDEYKSNPNAATLSLRENLYKAIEQLVININSKSNYEGFELIREIYGKAYARKKGVKNSLVSRFHSDRDLVKKLDELETVQPEEASKIVEQTRAYNEKTRKKGLRSWLVENTKNNFIRFARCFTAGDFIPL